MEPGKLNEPCGNKMKIKTQAHCMVVYAHYPLGETRVQRQAEALLAHGIAVDIICLRASGEPDRENINGARVYRLPVAHLSNQKILSIQLLKYLAFFALAMFKLIHLHRQRRFSVVQVHNLPDFLIFAAWYPRLRGARLILDLHDLMPEFYASRTGRALNSRFVRFLMWQERLACRFADHVLTVTGLWRRTLIERGVPADKVTVVMNLADDRFFRRQAGCVRVKDPAQFKLIYHGSLVPRYGLDLLLEAVARLKDQIPGLRLTIHGNGRYRPKLIGLAQRLGVRERVNFSNDYLPMTGLPELLRQADLAVVPYRRDVFTDGILPTKLLEYTAVGVPALVARTAATAAYFDETMVEFFEAGNLDELAEGILALSRDRARLEALVQGSSVFNRRHKWTRHSQTYVDLVKRLSTPE